MPRPFTWVEATGPNGPWRHAIERQTTTQGQQVHTICGEQAEVHAHHPQLEAPYPECRTCDRTWRQVEGIPSVFDQVSQG